MAGGNLTVIKKGATIYYRVKWNATYDYVCGFTLATTVVPYTNNNVNFIDEGLVLVGTANSSLTTASYFSTLKGATDDACPAKFNTTYIGANHGGAFINQITANGHGKANVDIGSEWKDTANKKWYLMRVVDANTLWFISENQVASPAWSFLTSVGGNSLVHSLSATNTGTITVTGNVTTQLYPAYKNTLKKVYLDGITELIDDGVYSCNFLEVLHSYDISDVPSIITFIRARVGSPAAPVFDDTSIANVARMAITYRVTENGAVTLFTTFTTNQQITLGSGTYVGFTQSGPITPPAGGTIYDYAPKITSHVVSGRTYDFTAIQDITTFADIHDIVTSMWTDANNPPERFVQFVKDSGGVKTYGNAVGYNQKVGIGQPAIRKTLIDSAWYFYSTKKLYPNGISSGSPLYSTTVPAGKVFDMVSFRYPINYPTNSNLTNFGWYSVFDDVYVNIDAHTTITNQWYQLPTRFAGMKIEVIEKNTDFTLNSNFVGQDGINFSVANSYGTAVLRLTPELPKSYPATISKATSYTATAYDEVIEVTATGQTITLPSAAAVNGWVYTIKLTASGSATVATLSGTIDGSSTYSLASQYKYVSVKSNGTNYIVIANN